MRVLVTGASGFVGSAMLTHLATRGYQTIGTSRLGAHGLMGVGDIGPCTDWSDALTGVEAVVHLAARAHVHDDSDAELFTKVNVEGTEALARQAARAHVRRFVYCSTVGVLGRTTHKGQAVDDESEVKPQSSYALSKLRGEEALFRATASTGMEAVVLRPPLVYGPGNRGNMLRLLRLLEVGLPLPFGRVQNSRSLISLPALCSALERALVAPAVVGRRLVVADDVPVSTTQIVLALAEGMGRSCRLFPVPYDVLRRYAPARLGSALDGLFGNLEVDNQGFKALTGWRPDFDTLVGLEGLGRWYVTQRLSGQHPR